MLTSVDILPRHKFVPLVIFVITILCISFSGCGKKNYEESIRTVTDEEAEQLENEIQAEVSITTENVFEFSLWASEELLGDPVGINFDHEGRAWIATTNRRRTSIPNAGDVSHWNSDNLSWETVEDMKDFLHREVISERSKENIWLQDFNKDGIHDWRDMAIEKDSVFMLEDLTQNGYANQARVMDWDFYSETTEVTGSVLHHEGDLFVVRAPHVLRIKDSNGDGIWDLSKSISQGYGVHISSSGHGMSSLKIGPDGRIYWALGDIGLNVIDKEGKKWVYPDAGAIVRSELDGSKLEVYATGLRNLHEFDFDKYGNLIGIDNDGPFGDFDRLVYVIDGSDSGWRIYWQRGKFDDPKNNDYNTWLEEEYYNIPFDGQTAHILPPLAPSYRGPAGFVYNPGSALNEEWEDHFFASSFVGSPNRSGINAFTLKEKGASFEVDKDREVLRGLLSTSLDIGPDGALYTTDWIEGWATKGTGRIWKIDTPADFRSINRRQTQNLLAEDFSEVSSEELMQYLGYEDMRVRKKAQFELVKRDATDYLIKALDQEEHQLQRIHAIWGLGQVGRSEIGGVEPLMDYINDPDPEIRAQIAKILGDVRLEQAANPLIPLLHDDNSRVRFFAAEALGRIGHSVAFEPIIEMIRENDDKDVYLRQAGAIALGRIGDEQGLKKLADDPSRAVRITALVALKRMKSPGVARFLHDNDEAIVTDAARAINDGEFIKEGLPELANMLLQDRFNNEALLRRSINANLYGGTLKDAERLAAFSLSANASEELRMESLKALSVWAELSVFDRVTGKYRGSQANNPDFAREAAEPAIVQILSEENNAVKITALQTAANLGSISVIPEILGLIHNTQSSDVHIASINALYDLNYDEMEEVISTALEEQDSAVRMAALNLIPNLNFPAENTTLLLERLLENGTIKERKAALKTLAVIDEPPSYATLDRQMDLLLNGDLAREVQLDLILAIEALSSEPLHEKLNQYQSEKPEGDALATYSESLYGGDTEAGQRIFSNHEGAQCSRCHTGNAGAGPDLESVGSRLSRQQILKAMVDPDARIAPGYGVASLTLLDGNNIRGALSAESDTHIILIHDGEELEFSKTDIVDRKDTPSAMPAMGDILTRSELRNLIEYLVNKN